VDGGKGMLSQILVDYTLFVCSVTSVYPTDTRTYPNKSAARLACSPFMDFDSSGMRSEAVQFQSSRIGNRMLLQL
jgi:hypothetical protein